METVQRHTPEELTAFRKALYDFIEKGGLLSQSASIKRVQRTRGVSLEVHDRRVPIYNETIRFLRLVCGQLNPETQECLKFSANTEMALFLFDDALAGYLQHLFKEALRLHILHLKMVDPHQYTPEITSENMKVSLWFTEQFEVTRAKFAPFLRLKA